VLAFVASSSYMVLRYCLSPSTYFLQPFLLYKFVFSSIGLQIQQRLLVWRVEYTLVAISNSTSGISYCWRKPLHVRECLFPIRHWSIPWFLLAYAWWSILHLYYGYRFDISAFLLMWNLTVTRIISFRLMFVTAMIFMSRFGTCTNPPSFVLIINRAHRMTFHTPCPHVLYL
jgi:hypothetical protein